MSPLKKHEVALCIMLVNPRASQGSNVYLGISWKVSTEVAFFEDRIIVSCNIVLYFNYIIPEHTRKKVL